MPKPMPISDAIDRAVDGWAGDFPDLDLLPMAVFLRLVRFGALATKAVDATFDRFGLTSGEFDVLAALRRAAAPRLTPSALAAELMLSPAGMTNRLDRLETAGLVQRRPAPSDRRSVEIEITAKALELLNEAVPAHVITEARLLSGLDAEQLDSLDQLLRRALGALSTGAAVAAESPATKQRPATGEPLKRPVGRSLGE